MYGGGEAPEQLELDHKTLIHQPEDEAFYTPRFSRWRGRQEQQVLLRARATCIPFRLHRQHVDFQRVREDEEITHESPDALHERGAPKGVKEQGGVVSHLLNESEILCLPDDLPEFEIDVDRASS